MDGETMRDPVKDMEARTSWRGVTIAAVLALGSPVELLIGKDVKGMSAWPPLLAGAVGLVLLVFLFVRRHRPSRRLAGGLFLLNTAAVVISLYASNQHFAELGTRWAPFQANKLGVLTVGILTPELWVGLASIAAYAGSAVIQWLLFAPGVKAHLAVGEPAVTCVFAVFGVVLLWQSRRRFALERKLVIRHQEALAADQLARVALAVRDFANTPLQVIESAADLARLRSPNRAAELEIIARAINRLRELNKVLAAYAGDIDWQKGGESFDALEVLVRGAQRPH
jgi:hypothetical protein